MMELNERIISLVQTRHTKENELFLRDFFCFLEEKEPTFQKELEKIYFLSQEKNKLLTYAGLIILLLEKYEDSTKRYLIRNKIKRLKTQNLKKS